MSSIRDYKNSQLGLRVLEWIGFLFCLSPLIGLCVMAMLEKLGPSPVAVVTMTTGIWTLRFLTLTLAVTPVRRITGWNGLIRYRRRLGLFAFTYGVAHFLTYIWLDHFFHFSEIVHDVEKRPFIVVGFVTFVLMIPLAITSTDRMVQRLGGKRWRFLHRLIYMIAMGGVIHFYWLSKPDVKEPLIYATMIGILLLYRIISHVQRGRGP